MDGIHQFLPAIPGGDLRERVGPEDEIESRVGNDHENGARFPPSRWAAVAKTSSSEVKKLLYGKVAMATIDQPMGDRGQRCRVLVRRRTGRHEIDRLELEGLLGPHRRHQMPEMERIEAPP